MVIYYATTYYHVLCAIIHKLLYEKNSQSYILISDNRAEHEKLCERLKKTNIFDNVIYYQDRLLVSVASREFNVNPSKFNMNKLLENMCREVEKITPFEINSNNTKLTINRILFVIINISLCLILDHWVYI